MDARTHPHPYTAMKPAFTIQEVENKAKELSKAGSKLRLVQTGDEWAWDWMHSGITFIGGKTNAADKRIAFLMALGFL